MQISNFIKLKLLIISMLIIGLSSCNNNVQNACTNSIINVSHLETEYGCSNVNIDLSETYMIISNPLDFSEFVNTTCQSDIDFTNFDLVIGKKGLTNGLSSIEYGLIENCETENLNLTITFNLNETTVAPNIAYNALIPKLNENQVLTVDIVINH